MKHLWLLLLCLTACTLHREHELDRRFGREHVRDREVAQTHGVDYATEVKPILEARCIVCHGCFDSPCQLDLASPEGVERGAIAKPVYDPTRLIAKDPTRLFEDEQRTEDWRARGFTPVLNERGQSSEANREATVLLRALELKRDHPLEIGGDLPEEVTLGLYRKHTCPTIAEYDRYARKNPQWGMPYGLPGLDERQHDTIARWIAEGALHGATPKLSQKLQTRVAEWERFLNGDSNKHRLTSRYLFEHLFFAHLWFGDDGERPQFFELVRSKTPPGQPIARIATRRPYDDPGVTRVWYRLLPLHESIIAKQHMPYRLDAARMKKWKEWFIDADYEVVAYPSHAPEIASNPFQAFAAMPVRSRYRFLLDEAEYTLMGFIKGPVCRGEGALNVIDDAFWVFFVDPDLDLLLHDDDFLRRNAKKLRLPARASSTALPLRTWVKQSRDEHEWSRVKQKALAADFAEHPIDLELVWDGDGDNRSAALTVFRHHDSATVVKGLVGEGTKTAWVIDYPVLERIHYLLVAGFDVYGNVGHQLATRTYMDFLRMESELMFLQLLPDAARKREHAYWYRDTEQRLYRDIVAHLSQIGVDTALRYGTNDPKRELYTMLQRELAPVLEHRWDLDALPDDMRDALRELAARRGDAVRELPEAAFLLVPDAPEGAQLFTILKNDGHTNIASPFFESHRRRPKEDTLTIARGVVGSYPNAFFVVERAHLPELTRRVRRTDADFWEVSDRIAEIWRRDQPLEYGVLDLGRYERPTRG
ncbi:MAG TPA: fatty acid cis/trans isomerase [Nannocystaceae bacterium]|nr:fatty acid cis/trans isomerase [Nannocystaceae bacterium]